MDGPPSSFDNKRSGSYDNKRGAPKAKSLAYPHNLDAERAVLGAILIENDSISSAMESVQDVDFYLEKHRKIYGRMVALYQKGEPIDLITLSDSFNKDNELEDVGGLAYLSSLTDSVPLTSNAGRYSRIIKEKSILRRLLQVSADISEKVIEGGGDADELLDSAESALFEVTQQKQTRAFRSMQEVIKTAFARIESLYDRGSEVTGISTGFAALDKMLAGLHDSDLLILAARPAMGKTAFALNILANAALREGKSCCFFSLEMSADQLAIRILCSEARVDAGKVRTGALDEDDWRKLARAAERLYNSRIYIDDKPGLNVLEMRSKCRRLHMEQGLDLVMVDYLQLMSGAGKLQSREQEISQISRSLKGLAKELEVPVIALSQLNRSLESRVDKRPMMSDLRESGAIEQDADIIMFIYREAVYAKKDQEGGEAALSEEMRRKAEIIIGKQRNGPIGTVELAFQGRFTRFENVAEDFYGIEGGGGE